MLGLADGRAEVSRARRLLLGFGFSSNASRWLQRREVRLFCLTAIVAVGGCASGGGGGSAPQASLSPSISSPMFPESKWGVKASERVVDLSAPIPKGGGIYKVGDPYQVGGRWYDPREQPDYDRVGIASWYGEDFHGRRTSNGEIYDMNALTAAHPTLPMPSYAYVTNLSNNRTILVRINDRGPYVADRVIDLSKRSADELGLKRGGTGQVRVKYAGPAPLDGNDIHERRFLASGQGNVPQSPRYADAGQPWTEPAPQRYAPPARVAYDRPPQQPYYAQPAPAWQAPGQPAATQRQWAMNDTTASAPTPGYAAPAWSPAAYRASLKR
jgi:rare lipoprotein A